MELLNEIIINLKAHKLRTLLTSFGIAWGIFILVVLLGISGGVQDGVFKLFKGFTSKTIWFYGGESSDNITYRSTGSKIVFQLSDIETIKNRIPKISNISPEIILPNYPVQYRFETGNFGVSGCTSQLFELKSLKIKEGRRLNQQDIILKRRVAIIGDRVVKHFFTNKEPLGEYINLNGIDFSIVGLLDDKSFLALNEQNNIFIPQTSFEEIIKPILEIQSFGVNVNAKNTKPSEERIRKYLANKYRFDEKDEKALYVVNYEDQMSVFSKFFNGFNLFLIFVGVCLLLSGVVGVSNVMYIIVKERTQEIGIKKAIGATSSMVLKEVIIESLLITVLSGLIGFLAGFGMLKLIDLVLSNQLDSDQFMSRTVLEPQYMILAMIILTISGLVAGFFPAHKAANIKPVEAIQSI